MASPGIWLAMSLSMLSLPLSTMAADAAYPCKVGDPVDGWNVDWYPATVAEIGAGNHSGYCLLKWEKFATPTWIKATSIRARQNASGGRADTVANTPPAAKYTCGVFLNGAFTYTQAVTLQSGGAYQSTAGSPGKYRFDSASRQVIFDGGALAGVVGHYEPENQQIIRLTAREDGGRSAAAQKWRSQVCSPQR